MEKEDVTHAHTHVLCCAKSPQLCPTLRDPMDCNPPDSCPWDSPGKNT